MKDEHAEEWRWPAWPAAEVHYEKGVFHLRRGTESYDPLTRRGLLNAFMRIASVADVKHDERRKRQQQLTQRLRAKGAAEWTAKAKAELMVKEEIERATVRAITAFYRRYGRLGFAELRDPEQHFPEHGEPLGWIVAEAHTAAFAVALLDNVNNEDVRGLERALDSRLRRLPEPQSGTERSLPGRSVPYLVARRVRSHGGAVDLREPFVGDERFWYDESAFYRRMSEQERDLFAHGGQIAADLVRAHLAFLQYTFIYRDGRFLELPIGGPLLRAIWLQVKATATQRLTVRRCRECGAQFVVTDKRQNYCPALQPGGKSPCLTRAQMRRQRHQQGGTSAGEEATE